MAATLLFHIAVLALLIHPRAAVVVDAPAGALEVSLAGPSPHPAATVAAPSPSHPPPSPPDLPVRPVVTVVADGIPTRVDLAAPAADPVLDPAKPSLVAIEALSASQSAASGKPCEIATTLQSLLQTDPAVREALTRIPRDKRSVAGAVMLWKRTWVSADAVGGVTAMEPIQSAIVQAVGAAEPNCRDETVLGPRLFIVGDTRGAIVLALGSGQWRWSDLLPQAATPATPLDQLFHALAY